MSNPENFNHNKPPRVPEEYASLGAGDLFENTHDLIQLFTSEGLLLSVNPSWRVLLERLDEELSQFSVYSVIHPQCHNAFHRAITDILVDSIPKTMELTMITKSNHAIIVEGTIGLVPGDGSRRILRGIFHDITKRKQYDELKDEFVGTVSHELRTPLTVIREGTAQLRDGLLGEVSADQKELLEMLIQNIDRLSRIINDLLDVSKLEAGQVRLQRILCNMSEIANEVIRSFEGLAGQKGLQLKVETSGDHVEVYLDHDKFIQVLTNLVGNAIKFTSEGHVKISIRELEGFIECKVTDTGRGISGEDLPKVFEKFSQFGRTIGPGIQGTGLGLSICKKLIDLHHGKISVESYPLKGTSITMLLPKYTSREIFREHIAQALNRCVDEGGTLSLIIFDLVDFETLKKTLGDEHLKEIVGKMEKMINDSLRRAADVAIKNNKAILVLLPDTKRDNAYIVLGRLYQLLEEYLLRIEQRTKIEIHSCVATFPEDARTVDEILEKIYD